MFTGIVETVADVRSVRNKGSASTIRLDMGSLRNEVEVGDSVMINGVCLTATELTQGLWDFDVSSETLRRTTLGSLRSNSIVNVELAMQPAKRFGGHFVSGHVDGTGRIRDLADQPGETRMGVEVPSDLSDLMIMKGSVAVDGISLTIAQLSDGYFEVSLIPHTLETTTLSDKRVGDNVNIECDMIGKWVRKFTGERGAQSSQSNNLTLDKLRETGF